MKRIENGENLLALLRRLLIAEAIGYLADYADEMESEADSSAGIENIVLGDCSSADKDLYRAGDIRRIVQGLKAQKWA